MVRGSVYKRCQCRDGDGRRVKDCGRPHGSWGYTFDVGPRGAGLRQRRRQVVRSGFASREAAGQALAGELSLLATGVWVDDRDLTLGWWLQTWLSMQVEAGRSVKTLANAKHTERHWSAAGDRAERRAGNRAGDKAGDGAMSGGGSSAARPARWRAIAGRCGRRCRRLSDED